LTRPNLESIGIYPLLARQIVIACPTNKKIVARSTIQAIVSISSMQLVITRQAMQNIIAQATVHNIVPVAITKDHVITASAFQDLQHHIVVTPLRIISKADRSYRSAVHTFIPEIFLYIQLICAVA